MIRSFSKGVCDAGEDSLNARLLPAAYHRPRIPRPGCRFHTRAATWAGRWIWWSGG